MDYDDNDFQCQNFHLAGEDNSKFPPNLQSFSLPKFDLDEHLHSSLRFDSLVETEVLLGIQGRENNWIEDFTSVGSEIEFSSTAAGSCSISRHKNVWSEATSSESVEMLLKSFGEDEMVDQKAIIEVETDNGLNHMDGQMDTCLRQNDPHNSEAEYIAHNDPLLPPAKCEKSLSCLSEDAVKDKLQDEDTPAPSKNEESGTDMNVSSLSEKLNSDQSIVANQYSMDEKLTSNYATVSSSVIDEAICDAVQNNNPLHNASVNKCVTNDHIANAMSGENSDLTFRTAQDDPSSVSTSDLVLGSKKMNAPMFSEPVMGQYSEIEISGKSRSFAADGHKESSQIRDNNMSDQHSQGSLVRRGHSNAEDSSFLEATMNSLMLLNEGCNEPEFSVNSDGLLDAITQQVQALDKVKPIDKVVLPTMKDSLVMEGERNTEKSSVEISIEDIADLSHVTEGYKSAGYGGPVHTSKDDSTYIKSTRSTENTNIVDSHEGKSYSLMEVMEEKQNTEVQLKDNGNSDVGNASKFTEKVRSSSNMSFEMAEKETNDAGGLRFDPLNLTSQNANSIVIAKYTDDEVDDFAKGPEVKFAVPIDCRLGESPPSDEVEDIFMEPEIKFNARKDARLGESLPPASQNDSEKLSSSPHSNSFDKCDTEKLAAESLGVHTFSPEVATFTKENTAPSTNSGRGNTNDDPSIVKEMEDASSAGQKTVLSTVTDCSSAKNLTQAAKNLTQGESEVTSLAAHTVNLHFSNDSANVHQSQRQETLPSDVVVKQKEATSSPLPAFDFVQPDEKEVVVSQNTILKSNLDAQMSRGSVEVSDLIVNHSLDNNMPQDEPGKLASANNSVNFCQSESEDAMVVDVVGEQNIEAVSGSHVSDFIHSSEKEIKICRTAGLSVLKGISNAQISSGAAALLDSSNDSLLISSTEVQPIIAGQCSSSAEGSDVGCENELQSSIDNPVPLQNAAGLERNVAVHASSIKKNVNSDTAGSFSQEMDMTIASVETANHDEKQTMPVPSLLEKSSGDIQTDKQRSDHNIGGDDCHKVTSVTWSEGDAANSHTNNASESVVMARNSSESDKLESENANPSSIEQNCGSPTIISCSEHSQVEMDREGNIGLPDSTDPVSDDLSPEMVVNGEKVESRAHHSKDSTASEDDKSFTFEVGSIADLSERGTGNEWKPFSNMHSFQLPQSNLKTSKENSEECHLQSAGKLHGTITKTPDEDNTRQVSDLSATERTATSHEEVAKETSFSKQSAESDGSQCGTLPKSAGAENKSLQLEETQHSPYIESNIRASCSPTVLASNLPDLNTSISPAALFHQPFTDLQQLQLRAQIFVYGSLIQGIPPDEACMISAFGETDGGRSLWEGVWRISVERYQNQKSPFGSCETPLLCQSGVRVSEPVTRCSSLQSKTSSTPSRSVNKVVSSATANSTMPLPSPLWSISSRDGLHSNMPRVTHLDFNQALSPLSSHQSSQLRQYAGNVTPWLSQTPRPGPWAVSSQNSMLDATAQYSTLPVAETVQVTPVRDSSVPRSLNVQLLSPTALLTTPGTTSVSAGSVVQAESQRKTTTPGNNTSVSTVQKSRKRKKGTSATEKHQQNILLSQSLAEPASATGVTKHSPTPISAGLNLSANSPAKVASGGLVSATSHIISPTHYQIISRGDTEQRAIFSEEMCSNIEQSKLQVEDAAALAASTVRHSQGIWSQLANQKNSGLVSEVEEKLASAAVAAAAAASVAKAAAAAAKVASDAALQAKMMADEALNSVKTGNLAQIPETCHLDVGKSLARLTPGSILKGKDKVHGSCSIISAAREAARRRLEAASAATKRAENLDAIVRAAELAAEAVFQAGTIVTMGEPLPFTLGDLVEAGREGYWKGYNSTTHKLAKTSSLHQEEHIYLDGADNCDKVVEDFNEHPLNNKETKKTADKEGVVSNNEHPMESEKHYEGNLSGNASAVPIDGHEKHPSARNNKEISIQKGSLVEVINDEDGLRGVWFSASVLDVKDGKAYVCYNNLVSDEGTNPLKEWISLEGEGDNAPRIRLAHPITAAKYEGTRKRRREAIGNYIWAVGDRVDAWIRDGWWEGIVTEKSQGDDTKLTVHFPDGGDSSIVRAWNLRPSLVWKDGHWIEWSRGKEAATPHFEGDTPQEKRQKIGRPEVRKDSEVDGKGMNKLSKNLLVEDSRKPEDSRPLILSAKDKIFSVGKNAGKGNNSDALKIRRTGLQKEGSRVVFGVPKPGKKRKFMEVSKHYVADKTDKVSEGNDSIKFAKYLMPQASRAWKSASKVDPKGKIVGDSKPKGLKGAKSQSIQTRSTAGKDNSSIPTSNIGEAGHGSLSNVRVALSSEQNNLEKKNQLEVCSNANGLGTAASPHVEPFVQPVSGVPTSKKKTSSAVEADSGVKGKLMPAVDKSTRIGEGHENTGKTMSDVSEPRRSSRRIQPTSRLLEGLQSSLIISKIPSFSHDKGAKVQHRGASSRGNAYG